MRQEPTRAQVVGQTLIAVCHSAYSKPEFILQGIGPASFRTHFLSLSNGCVLDLFVAELMLSTLPDAAMPGETDGLAVRELIGRPVEAVVKDDTSSVLVVLNEGIFLKDANDGVYGNPLLAGFLSEHYKADELRLFVDYWTEEPLLLKSE